MVASYGKEAANLYAMTDMLTNYTSLMIFIFIGFALIGGLRNRNTNEIKVEQKRFFKTLA